MADKIKCPQCGGTNCYSIDSQPPSHDREWFKQSDLQHDYELTMDFVCEDCPKKDNGKRFTFWETFDLVQRQPHPAADNIVTT